MHAIIVGCGRVGSELAISLTEQGHSVVIVDRDQRAFKRLPDTFTGKTVVGLGFDRDTLCEAGVTHADALAAVTSGDNSNILTARVAREHYEVEKVVARIYDPRRAALYQRLGIPTVATVTWTMEQILRKLNPDESVAEWTDPTGGMLLVERNLPPELVGTGLDKVNNPTRWKLVSVARAGTQRLAEPGMIAQEGDVLYVAVSRRDFPEFDKFLATSVAAATPAGGDEE